MKVDAFRIVDSRRSETAFTGDGARIFGGRWNSMGRPVVYVSGSVSLAKLEMLVHLTPRDIPGRFLLFHVAFPESMVQVIAPDDLPRNWQAVKAPKATQAFGDDWLKAAAIPVLRVPSAVTPNEWNYLLNPAHPDFSKISVGPPVKVKFDPRLIKKS